jgi:hypothetical protein
MLIKPKSEPTLSADPWTLYLYAMRSPETKEKYLMRLGKFLGFLGIQGTLEDKARFFADKGKCDSAWAFNSILEFLQAQKERFNRKEITAGTIRNYVKSIKLFCQMADVSIPWEKITRGLPRGKRYSGDGAPTLEEIRKLCECSQAQKLQNYVEQFKNGQHYQEIESVVKSEVEKTLLDNRKLLQNALFSLLLSLRNDPDRYLIIDRTELSPFTTNTIINYNSFLRSQRGGTSQFVSERVLERAERILVNLQKNIVDNTISTAARSGDGRSPHAITSRALPYYEFPSQLSTEQS